MNGLAQMRVCVVGEALILGVVASQETTTAGRQPIVDSKPVRLTENYHLFDMGGHWHEGLYKRLGYLNNIPPPVGYVDGGGISHNL